MPGETNKSTSRDKSVLNGIGSPQDTATIARNLICALKRFGSDQGFHDLAELIDRIPNLEKEIQERDQKLQKANEDLEKARKDHLAEVQNNLRTYGGEYKQFQSEKASLNQTIERLEQTIEKSKTENFELQKKIDDLKAAGKKVGEAFSGKVSKLKEAEAELVRTKTVNEDLRKETASITEKWKAAKNHASELKQSFDQSKQDCSKISSKYEATLRKLEELKNFSVPLEEKDEEDVAAKLSNVWGFAASLVRTVFSQDLPDDLLERPWKVLNENAKELIDTPLPRSNSPIAKEIRIIVVLGMLIDVINKHIFQPTYLLPEEGRFKDLLYMLASKEPEKERFLRGMMLSILPDERRNAEERIVSIAVRDFLTDIGVEEIIPPNLVVKFRQDVTRALTDAQEVWRAVRYSRDIFGCEFEYNPNPGTHWQAFKYEIGHNTASENTPASVSGNDLNEDLVVIVPRILFIEQGKNPQPITAGIVVRKSQIRTMTREERDNSRSADKASSHSRRMQNSTRDRRTSEAFLYQAAGDFKLLSR